MDIKQNLKYEDYADPLFLLWNRDINGNRVSVKITNEPRLVRHGMCIMKGLPDKEYHVRIKNMIEVENKEILELNEFEIDYTQALVRFNPSMDDKEIIIEEYWSRGNFYYPAHRILWTVDELTGEVLSAHDVIEKVLTYFDNDKKDMEKLKQETEEMINNFKKELEVEWTKILEKFNEFQLLINKSEVTKEELNKMIIKALTVHQDLNNLIKTVEDMNLFTGVAKHEKIIIDNAEFPLIINKDGNELGLVKDGLVANDIFRYCSMVIKFSTNSIAENPIIYNVKSKEFIKVNMTIKKGDIISIATSFYRNSASLYTKVGDDYKIIDITDKLETNTSYFYLSVGNNKFIYDCKSGDAKSDIFFDGKNLEKNLGCNGNNDIVTSINGKTGDVVLNSDDINAYNKTEVDSKFNNIKAIDIKTSSGQTVESTLAEKATKTDVGTLTSLNTTNKTNIVSAINELFTDANNGKTAVANAITAKGVSSSPTDTFSVLATKIGQISTGKKYARGTIYAYNDEISVTNLNFKPSIIIASLIDVSSDSYNNFVFFTSLNFLKKSNETNLQIARGTVNGGTGQFEYSSASSNDSLFNGGFLLHGICSNKTYDWIAIE